MRVEIVPLRDDLAFGCRVTGLTLAALSDKGLRAQLTTALDDRGLILFSGVEPTNNLQIEISRVFGPLKEHPVKAVDLVDSESVPGVMELRSDPATGDIVEIEGKCYSSWLPWHFDHCYNNELNRAGVLRAVELTPNGGQTCFADGIALYHELSAELRGRIEGLSVIYSMDMRLDQLRFGRPEDFRVLQVDPILLAIYEQSKEYPRAIHPAVWTRPTGEKVLHLSPWMAEGIEGFENPEGDALLEAVACEIVRLADAHAYVHDWQPTDMVIWDNWRMLHHAAGCTPPHRRAIYRSTIKGDYGLGRFENDDTGRYVELERTV